MLYIRFVFNLFIICCIRFCVVYCRGVVLEVIIRLIDIELIFFSKSCLYREFGYWCKKILV